MCNNDERLINSCIISGVIIFLLLLIASVFILLFSNSNNIKIKTETNVMGIISIITLSLAFFIIVFILFHRYCLEPFHPNSTNEMNEIIVEGNSSL